LLFGELLRFAKERFEGQSVSSFHQVPDVLFGEAEVVVGVQLLDDRVKGPPILLELRNPLLVIGGLTGATAVIETPIEPNCSFVRPPKGSREYGPGFQRSRARGDGPAGHPSPFSRQGTFTIFAILKGGYMRWLFCRPTGRRGKPGRARPVVEALEGRYLPSSFTTFALPTPNSAPTGIVAGPDGNLWFTEANANQIGRITPGGAVTEFAVPTAGSGPTGIAVGPDGNLWFTEINALQIGRITPAGVVTEFRLPTSGFRPVSITSGPGGALWFTEVNVHNPGTDQPTSQPPVFEPTHHAIFGGQIGRISTSGTVTEFALPTGADPNGTPRGITAGPDGNLWFTERDASDRPAIGRLTPGGAYTQFAAPFSLFNQSGSITVGPDGALWFTEPEYPAYIGRITTSGSVTEPALVIDTSGPRDIAVGGDGNLWITQYDQMFGNSASLTRLTPAGVATRFPLANSTAGPFGMTADHNGNLWFTDLVAGDIVELNLGSAAAATVVTLSASANPAVAGQAVVLTATVAAVAPGMGTPTGSVTFLDNGARLGTAMLDASGRATFTAHFAAGSHTLQAVYGGDGNFLASTRSLAEQVNPSAGVFATVTTLSASAGSVPVGQSVTFTATVTAGPGTGTPTGTVTFLDGSVVLGTVTLPVGGRATFTTTFRTLGRHTVKAVYGGDAEFAASAAVFPEEVIKPRKRR
jgi:streptogramin lyase